MKNRIVFKLSMVIVSIGLFVLAVESYVLKNASIESGVIKATSIAEVIKDGLTTHMVTDTMDKRDIFLRSIIGNKYINELSIIRAQNVVDQYGKSTMFNKKLDDIDKKALNTGEVQYKFVDGMTDSSLRITVPYQALGSNEINCISCHNVNTGDTLGGVSMLVNIDDIKSIGISSTLIIFIVVLLSIALAIYYIGLTVNPYTKTLEIISSRIDDAVAGKFNKIEINNDFSPELKGLMIKYNQLTDNVLNTFINIDKELKSFIGTPQSDIINKNPLEEANEIITNLSLIYQFKNKIQLDCDRHEIYHRFGQILQNKFLVDFMNVIEVRDNKPIEIIYSHGSLDFCSKTIIENSEGCRVLKNSKDISSVEYHKACPHFTSDNYKHYCMDIEIGKSSKIIFNLIFENKEKLDLFSRNVYFVKSYINEMAPEIQSRILREELEESALKDTLTGLHNRRFLEAQLNTIVPQAKREEFNIGMLMLDIDHFKAVNDEYGHDIGDKVLQEFSSVLAETTRNSDLAVRFGGEEFIVLLIGVKSEEDALAVANKIREKVAATKIDVYAGSTLSKTVSIGLSMFPEDSDNMDNIFKYSDLALYEAKNTGRNQVVRYVENPKDELELF